MLKIKGSVLLASAVILTACGGGDDTTDTTDTTPEISLNSCSFTMGDSTQNPATGRAEFTRSHTVGNPDYQILTTRQKQDGSVVTMDYMVHEPTGTAKAIVLLIAGGPLNAGISGTEDGDDGTIDAPTNSRGNYLVRSAHRYQSQGYRVITIDRPSDYLDYDIAPVGLASFEMDAYRNSMRHAVDLATILQRENTERLDVIISGTSRGAISAVAMNTLAAGIGLSSPLVGGAGGSPIGSNNLPLSRIERASHILLHTNDTCFVTLPADVRNLFDDLVAGGKTVHGNEVNGGFRDTDRNDECGGFDFHGFTGIEMCAVLKETTWMDNLISDISGNTPPAAGDQVVNLGDTITLTATDDDGDMLSYAVPYETTSIGGTVSTDGNGNVTYTAPAGVSGVNDIFAFTVTDGNGGVATGTIAVALP